jgi:RNA polymerase sigma-70 factor, ECF subfamily
VGHTDGGEGSPEFDAFFARHERPLYAYLRRLLPSEEAAVELAQEAFFRAWTHFAQIQHYDRPESWLYRVATNLAISALRRHEAAPLSQLRGLRRRERSDDDELDESMDAPFIAPLDIEEQTAQRDIIARVLRRLSERERAALLLRVVQGFSYEEVAEALGVSVANVRQILSRGRQRFRQIYDARRAQEPTS